jgi:hypothetical protein
MYFKKGIKPGIKEKVVSEKGVKDGRISGCL